MKPNPLYFFLSNQQPHAITLKSGYLMVRLNAPEMKQSIQVEGREVDFISHHVSVYEMYDEGTRYNSLYHYTANFDGFIVHVSIDSHGEQSEAYIKEDTQAYKSIARLLPDSEKSTITHLMLNSIPPVMHPLKTLHIQKIDELSARYHRGLKEIQDSLFEHTLDIDVNLTKIAELISMGESLKQISYHSRPARSLDYLKKQYSGIVHFKELSVSDKLIEDSVEKAPNIAMDSAERTPETITVKQSKPINAGVTLETAHLLCQTFEDAYDRVSTLIESYDRLLFNDFLGKRAVLQQASTALLSLFLDAETLMTLDASLIPNQTVLHKAGLGLDYLFHTCQEKGTLLLTLCLSSTTERLQTFGPSLSNYAKFVTLDCVDAAIRKGNTLALAYLIQQDRVAINRHQVKIAADKPSMPLICAAYKLKHLDCFIELLKNNANIFTIYKDGLPLAHRIYGLPVSNPFREALMEHSLYFPNKAGTFFSTLATNVSNKLLFDPLLTPEKRASLRHSFELYKSIGESGNITATSKNALHQSMLIARHLNQDALEELRQSPEYLDRMRTTMHLSKTFSQILIKQRQESTFKAQSTLFYKNINQQLGDSALLRQQFQTLGKEQILQLMDINISQLEDYIFIWTNQHKRLPKKMQKLLDEAVKRVQSAQKQSSSNHIQLIEQLENLKNITVSFSLFLKEFESHLPSSLTLEDDPEYEGLDFLAAAEESVSINHNLTSAAVEQEMGLTSVESTHSLK